MNISTPSFTPVASQHPTGTVWEPSSSSLFSITIIFIPITVIVTVIIIAITVSVTFVVNTITIFQKQSMITPTSILIPAPTALLVSRECETFNWHSASLLPPVIATNNLHHHYHGFLFRHCIDFGTFPCVPK